MSARVRWWWRAGVGLLSYAVLEATGTLLGFAPDALRLALLVAVGTAAIGLLRDSVDQEVATWTPPAAPSVVPPGSDARLAAYVRLIEDMQTARTPGGALRDHLVHLAGGQPDDQLDAQLDLQLGGPPRRLSLAEIDDYLRRIEER
jgi:hypothetical protein